MKLETSKLEFEEKNKCSNDTSTGGILEKKFGVN